MHPDVDLLVVFKASTKPLHKQQARDDARAAEQQYSRLIRALHVAGLNAVGRRGEHQGQLIILLKSSPQQLVRLLKRERHSDFVHGVSTAVLPTPDQPLDVTQLTPADRLRLIYAYVTAPEPDGGLGISPDAQEWDRIESVMALHDDRFNDVWLRSLAKRQVRNEHLDTIRSQFGEDVAFYFAFLVSYTSFLLPLALLGLSFSFLGTHYSPLYSTLLFLWSVLFVEYWRVKERLFAVRWNAHGTFRVETRRAQHVPGTSWWTRELRTLASVPVIALFAGILFALLSGIFVLEAFVATLYSGPGRQFIGFAPTILFTALVPRFLSLYQRYAVRLTAWENHKHQSSHDASLTVKTFALSSIVSYLGLALSAFVYVPFGENLMQGVQGLLRTHVSTDADKGGEKLFAATDGPARLDGSRLQKQMFAFMITNQLIDLGMENVLPYITRGASRVLSRRRSPSSDPSTPPKKKRVGFEDEHGARGAEREFLERVRREVALPEYGVFADYNEMARQFGYVVLWSTIWPLAPVMAYVNNIVELRSDAFKIVSHCRRPLPRRTDTIGPWLDCLSFLAWGAALTNSALVYLFRPALDSPAAFAQGGGVGQDGGKGGRSAGEVLATAALIALGASHGYIVLRAATRHVLERLMWKGSEEEARLEGVAREVKEGYLKGVEGEGDVEKKEVEGGGEVGKEEEAFWGYDEGLEEIQKALKEA